MQQEDEALLLIRLHLAQGKAKEALQEVMAWKEKAKTQGRQYVVLELLMLELQHRQSACHFAGDGEEARLQYPGQTGGGQSNTGDCAGA